MPYAIQRMAFEVAITSRKPPTTEQKHNHMPDTTDQGDIDVGQAGPEFRNWLAAEARRQGELHLTAQAANISAMETRATAILAWSVAVLIALATLASQHRAVPAAALAGICLFMAAASCVLALQPGDWHTPGYMFASLQQMGHQTEMQMNEAVASGYETGIQINDGRLSRFAGLLRSAWTWFSLSPVAALIGAGIMLFRS
jgi:hypothetical protein